MASSQSGSSKRTQSDGKKASRARCRARAAARRERNGVTQARQHQRNLALIQDHESTPWQLACALRAYRRLITCGKCRIAFEENDDGMRCPYCGGTMNLKAAWEKKAA